MKSLLLIGAVLLFLGLGEFTYSRFPVMVEEPYYGMVNKSSDKILQNGSVSALSTFYSKIHTFVAGDRVSIVAQIEDGTFSVAISNLYSQVDRVAQDNAKKVNLEYTIPSNGIYEINVKRYKSSVWIIYTTKTNAEVNITAHTTEQVLVQKYRYVATYPHKEMENVGIVMMIAGIGAGVLVIAEDKVKK